MLRTAIDNLVFC